jgi:hypothetical protein
MRGKQKRPYITHASTVSARILLAGRVIHQSNPVLRTSNLLRAHAPLITAVFCSSRMHIHFLLL